MRQLIGSTANANDDLWEVIPASTFDYGYSRKDAENQHRVDELLLTLAASEFPHRLGEIKLTPDGRVCVCDIGLKYRMSYRVDFKKKIIELIRVCDHKVVQGKDFRAR